jgi:hypothetical protein
MPPLSEGFLQMTLARDANFQTRLQYVLVQVARGVKEEPSSTPGHTQRSSYATTVINNPSGAAQSSAVMVVGGPNVIGTVTLEDSGPVTTVSDAALFSQVSAYWNALSGLDTQP